MFVPLGTNMAAIKVLKKAVDQFCHKIDNLTLERLYTLKVMLV